MTYRTILFFIALLLGACQFTSPTLSSTTLPATEISTVESPIVVQSSSTVVPSVPSRERTEASTTATVTRLTPTSTTRVTSTVRATATITVTSSPIQSATPNSEPTVELSPVDATQVANATNTAIALIATTTAEAMPTLTATVTITVMAESESTPSPTITGTAIPTSETGSTLPTPGPLPTASDGRYPKPQEAGFTISIVANSAENPIIHPTSLAWDSAGALYVSRQEGEIVKVAPDGTRTSFANFSVPVGMAFRPGTNNLYVAHRGGVTMVRDNNGDGIADTYQPFVTNMACCYAELHQTNGLQFGPDGWLYFAQGANSDHGEVPPADFHAGILRVNPDVGQSSLEYVAIGVRNSYDLTIRNDGQIFATDNGADFGPPEELNHIIPGQDYGWPYCYTNTPGEVLNHPSHLEASCEGTRSAIASFVPHASANGITTYEASLFPSAYRGNLFVALWSHIADAYRIVRVRLTPNGDTFTATYTPFITDFELPLDVAVGPDGALYIADWGPGRIYRVAYE